MNSYTYTPDGGVKWR